jgi:hypothetical protein
VAARVLGSLRVDLGLAGARSAGLVFLVAGGVTPVSWGVGWPGFCWVASTVRSRRGMPWDSLKADRVAWPALETEDRRGFMAAARHPLCWFAHWIVGAIFYTSPGRSPGSVGGLGHG